MTERREEHPTEDVLLMCSAINAGSIKEYIDWLEKRPKEELMKRFLDIICSKSSFMPIVFVEEESPIQSVEGVGFDAPQNVISKMLTKITLLLIVRTECEKLAILDEIQPYWTEKYVAGVKTYIQIHESRVLIMPGTRLTMSSIKC